MGEVLEVGSEAETCQMAGRGMNGLRGIVVCYNASNARYTLELDSGEMMSLRARNVKPCMAESPEEEEVQVEQPEPPVSPPVKKKKAPPSYLPKYSSNTMNDQDAPAAEDPKPQQQQGGGNIVDRFLYSMFGFIFDMSPSVLLLAIMAGYYANKFWTGWFFADEFGNDNESTNDDDGTTSSKSDAEDASSTPSSSPTRQRQRRDGYYDEYGYYHDYYYHPRPYYRRWYHWNYWGGGPHWWYWWGWYGVSGLFSVLIVAFFIYQFGTKQGKTDFSWRHVKERVLAFSFWDVMMYASLLEGAFLFLTRMAQQAAAGRGGGGGGGRRR